jgi:hypothetical protein
MLSATHFEAAGSKPASPAEIADRVHNKAGKALRRAHDIRSLGSALVRVLNDHDGRDFEPLLTAIDLAAIIEQRAAALAHRIDKISLELSSLLREMKVERAVP